VRSDLVIADAVRLAAAKVALGWRPLLWFWLSVLVIVVAGGAVLHYLGPLPKQPARDQVRSEPRRIAQAAREPPPTPASAYAAVSPPRQPDPVASPSRSQPAPDAQAPNKAEQANVKPSSQPRIIVHPAPASSSGAAVAEQLASQLGLASDQISVGTAAEPTPRAVIRFYDAEDHSLARRVGNELAQLGYAWRIENLAERPSTAGHQPLEIWLPKR